MLSADTTNTYNGIERRSRERRKSADRRNLVRYESVGSDRRVNLFRRKEDAFWLQQNR